MEYERKEIDPGSFADWMPSGAKMYQSTLNLGKIKYKKNGVKYEFTDIRPLDAAAKKAFVKILETMATTKGVEEISLPLSKKADKNHVELVIDILLDITWAAKKEGKNGWRFDGGRLVHGVKRTDDKVVFLVSKETSTFVYEYMSRRKESDSVSVYEILEAILNKDKNEMLKAMRDLEGMTRIE